MDSRGHRRRGHGILHGDDITIAARVVFGLTRQSESSLYATRPNRVRRGLSPLQEPLIEPLGLYLGVGGPFGGLCGDPLFSVLGV